MLSLLLSVVLSGGSIRLATTTSVENSGLLPAILPQFEQQTGIEVLVLPVGSGRALAMGRRGDVDAILSHSPRAEREFVEAGHGAGYRPLMRNYFMVVGPPGDPAGARGLAVEDGLARIAERGGRFASRGDDSGTHAREQRLWSLVSARPAGERYLDTGRGMGATLIVADERRAYTLIDSATFLYLRGKVDLVEMTTGPEPELLNMYTVMWISPDRFPEVDHASARRLVEWFTSAAGQKAIGGYLIDGEQVFEPVTTP